MNTEFTHETALKLLRKYNQDAFHILHGLTVEGCMRWFARELGYGEEENFWACVGLLHDIDFELYPEAHCLKAPELLEEAGAEPELIHAICSHGYGICCDEEPVLEMEKVLFAADELKKYKDKRFAAGCSRDIIAQGAERLGWTLDELMEKTILAMRSCEESIHTEMEALGLEA